jgi:hypothetical protein
MAKAIKSLAEVKSQLFDAHLANLPSPLPEEPILPAEEEILDIVEGPDA